MARRKTGHAPLGRVRRVLGWRRSTSARHFGRHPRLHRPVFLAAFEGWNDAGEAASHAADYLVAAWSGAVVGEIDGEEFFDYTQVRPETSVGDNGARRIVWPTTSLTLCRGDGETGDVIVLRGPEPQLRWHTYCDAVITVARRLGVERVVTLGAYLSEVTHGRPVPISGSAAVAGNGSGEILPSAYEGPTGIVGVLGSALLDAGIPQTSLWASVPCYSVPVSPKAALALVGAVERLLGRPVDTEELEAASTDYEERMDELVREDEGVAAYVARVEEMEDVAGAEVNGEGLADEIERYLRGRRSG